MSRLLDLKLNYTGDVVLVYHKRQPPAQHYCSCPWPTDLL